MTKKSKKGHRRLRWFVLPASLLTLIALLGPASQARALTGSTFNATDGNLTVEGTETDWNSPAPNLTIDCDLATGLPNSNAGCFQALGQPVPSMDNSFGQGTKSDSTSPTVVAGSIPPNKSDLSRFYTGSEFVGGSNFLYLGWERSNTLGSANMNFEINQMPSPLTSTSTGAVTLNRTAGDLLITFDFGGSGAPILSLSRWLTAAAGNTPGQCVQNNALPCWGNQETLGGSVAEGSVNSTTVSDAVLLPSDPVSLPAGTFGEAAINLTNAGVFPPGTCEAFGSAMMSSRSSASFTAELKDFVAPVPVHISNCGTVTIHKVTENGDSSFGYTTTGNLSPSAFSLANGGTKTYTNVGAGASSVTENLTAAQVSAGWTLKKLVCGTVNGTGTSATINGSTVNITMAAGGNVDCTYTNHINLSPTISTMLSETTANIGDKVTDSATLTGATANAGGTVTYSAYAGANTCTGTDLLNSTVTVTNGSVPTSAAFSPSAAGVYSFQAVYSGDGNNNGASSACSTEQLLVKTNPTIATTLSATSVNVGATVHDSSALTGATSDAGGTVAYTVYTDSGCSQNPVSAGTKTVTNGVVPDSNGITFNNAGTFYWQAIYSGDAKNNGASSACASEQLVVNKLQPMVSTAQNLIPNDNFTLSGATSNASGSITFNLYSPSDPTCSSAPALTQTVTVNGNNTYTTTNTMFTASTVGTWKWQSSYTGDSNNLPATSSCGTESFTIANG
jgi:hypothetical protein